MEQTARWSRRYIDVQQPKQIILRALIAYTLPFQLKFNGIA
jgi:hypothetical protein